MKRNYPFVRSAPRCAEELAELPLKGQLGIVAELRSLSDGGLMTAKKFMGLSAADRAAYLADALQDYDKATAYNVRGVAMPVRTADDAKNQEAWKDFGSRVEEAVTDLAREDCKQISTNYLEGGVLVMGYRPPKELHDPFVSVPRRAVVVPLSQLSGGAGELGDNITRLISELALLSVRGLDAGSKEAGETITRFFQGKPSAYLQEAITRIEGVASTMERDPEVPRTVSEHMLPYLRRIADVLKGQVSMQLC